MATIQRPLKLYGTRKYVDEVAADADHKAPILSIEVDADLDTIYTAWNGGVDGVNIKPGVITTGHIADGQVTDGKISSLSWDKVTGKPTYYPIQPGAISTSQISDGAVTGAKIADGTITTADIADGQITKYKIATGQSLFNPPQHAQADGPNNLAIPFGQRAICGLSYGARSYTYCIGFVSGIAFSTGTGSATLRAYLMAQGAQIADTYISLNIAVNQFYPWTLAMLGVALGTGSYSLDIAATGSNLLQVNVGRSQLIVIEPS